MDKTSKTGEPRIVRRKLLLAGLIREIDLRCDFTTDFEDLRRTMRLLLPELGGKKTPIRRYGFWQPPLNPAPKSDLSVIGARRIYFSGVEITGIDLIPSRMYVKALPESLYAVMREEERGTIAGYLGKEWLPLSQYRHNETIAGVLEVFDDLDNYGESGACDIMVPIREKRADE